MTHPPHLRYTTEHEWLDVADDYATVGVTSFATDALGDVVYVDLPAVGTLVEAGKACGEIESTKSVSDLVAPASGEVVEINAELATDPSAVSADPYGRGWLFRVRVDQLGSLLDADAYGCLTRGESA
jgi:glycine cleavage system H protein